MQPTANAIFQAAIRMTAPAGWAVYKQQNRNQNVQTVDFCKGCIT
jgi:hypothetical protein